MSEEVKTPTTSPLEIQLAEHFTSIYANNVMFEANAWDLKIIFGQLEQVDGQTTVKQQIAVTVPWAQAKLAIYWLRVQVEATEIQIGKIGIRKDLVPPEPPPLSPEQENDPEARAILELVQRLRKEFIASL